MNPNKVYYAVEGLNLISGNKTAGFLVCLPCAMAARLAALTVPEETRHQCNLLIRERLMRAAVLPEDFSRNGGIAFYRGTALPLAFIQDPIGGSLGLDHRELEDIRKEDLEDEYRPQDLSYTPHNVDAVGQSLALLVIVETWAEWASDQLVLESMRDTV